MNMKRQERAAEAADLPVRGFVPALIGATAVFALYISLLTYTPLRNLEGGFLGYLNESNFIKYILGLLLYALSFFVLRAVLTPAKDPTPARQPLSPKGQLRGFALAVGVIGLFLLIYLSITEVFFHNEPSDFTWRKLPFLLVLAMVATVVLAVLRLALTRCDCSSIVLYGAYAVTVLLGYASLLYINVVDLHHGVAYLESIVNAYHGVPYNIYTTGIYGHYGIFYGLILRLIRGNTQTLMHLVALSGALCAAACVYTIHVLTTKNYIRVTAAFTSILTVSVLRYSNYWQVQPHRVLFPLLTVAFVAATARRNAFTWQRMVGGFVLCAAAIVWNTESGMFCLAAFALCWLVHLWQRTGWRDAGMWKKYLVLGGGTAASFAGALLFVNLYNLICGGGFIFKDFFFPLFLGSYMNDSLRWDMPGIIQAWIAVLLLFFLLLGLGLYHTRFIRPNGKSFDRFAPVYVVLAVVSLLNFSYYANRAAYFNLDICCQTAAIAMALFADKFLSDWRGIRHRTLTRCRTVVAAVSLTSLVVLSVLASQIPFASVPLIQKYEAGHWDEEALQANANALDACVPEDYMLLGTGSSLLAFQLGRTPTHYYRDFSDLNVGGSTVPDQIIKDALEHGKVAFYLSDGTTVELMEKVLATGAFRLESKGMVADVPVQCYVLK